ncbi:MAG: 5-dehydro-2-deoxygluconokinase [Pseudomonadota bacterium]
MFDALRKGNFLVIGRAGMDLYADPPGTAADSAQRFVATVGGSAGNIAAGIARLGGQASLLTVVSDDQVGRFTLNELHRLGVGTDHVATAGGELRTSLAVVETRLEEFQSVIYRNGAADFALSTEMVGAIDFAAFGGVIITGTAFAAEPSRQATFNAIRTARNAGSIVILDLDYRPYSWGSMDEAQTVYRDACAQCDVVIGNDEEFAVIGGGGTGGEDYARSLTASLASIVVYKLGQHGARTYTKDGVHESGIFRVKALKPVGAGDGFLAGFISALSQSLSVEEAVRRGSAVAAIVVSGIGCSSAMPTKTELDEFIAKHSPASQSNDQTVREHHAHPAV